MVWKFSRTFWSSVSRLWGWGTAHVRPLVILIQDLTREDFELRGPTRDSMAVTKCLELTVGPCIQNPVLDIGPASLCLVFSFIPVILDLTDERVARIFC